MPLHDACADLVVANTVRACGCDPDSGGAGRAHPAVSEDARVLVNSVLSTLACPIQGQPARHCKDHTRISAVWSSTASSTT